MKSQDRIDEIMLMLATEVSGVIKLNRELARLILISGIVDPTAGADKAENPFKLRLIKGFKPSDDVED